MPFEYIWLGRCHLNAFVFFVLLEVFVEVLLVLVVVSFGLTDGDEAVFVFEADVVEVLLIVVLALVLVVVGGIEVELLLAH